MKAKTKGLAPLYVVGFFGCLLVLWHRCGKASHRWIRGGANMTDVCPFCYSQNIALVDDYICLDCGGHFLEPKKMDARSLRYKICKRVLG